MLQSIERILVVDDDADTRELFARRLSQIGYQCVTADGAEAADRALQQQEFSLMLLDIGMPGKTGLALLPELTVRYPDMAIVMVTGHDDTSTAVLAMQEGACDYVTKPVATGLLTLRVEKALARQALFLEKRAYQQQPERSHREAGQSAGNAASRPTRAIVASGGQIPDRPQPGPSPVKVAENPDPNATVTLLEEPPGQGEGEDGGGKSVRIGIEFGWISCTRCRGRGWLARIPCRACGGSGVNRAPNLWKQTRPLACP